MSTTTYIAITEKDFNQVLQQAAKVGIEVYQAHQEKADIRPIKQWAVLYKVDARTIIKWIEKGLIIAESTSPYRISKFEIKKMRT